MAFEELLMMERLTLAPGIQVSSPTKAIDSSKDEVVTIHVEDARPKPASFDLKEKQEPAWLQLNPDIPQEDPAIKEIHPALRDEPPTSKNEDSQFLPQQEIKPEREPDEVSQISSTTGYHDVSEGTIQDRASVRTDPTETFASAFESRISEDIDTDSIEVDPPEIPLRVLTMEEIAKHNKVHDMWLVVNEEVYDVTQFQHRHPGGHKSEIPLSSIHQPQTTDVLA